MHAMPIYEYACTACGERTEAKQGFDDPPLEICPICGGKLRKLYSPVGIVFKGSGFYSTDRKKASRREESKSAASDSDKGAGSKKGSDTSGKTDAKSKSKESSDG
jgi:putative FmdB family regulatory protein